MFHAVMFSWSCIDVVGESVVCTAVVIDSVIFVNENENGEKRENNEFVNKN